MRDWIEIPFSQALVKHRVGRDCQIKTAEMQEVGRFPVVDQGKEFIAGYTNDEDRVITDGLPYVVFGDHTRCFKFVDFPFVLGADGTKVLKPDPSLFDPKFFYFACRHLDIPSRGYNRHYTILKEMTLRVPRDVAMQRRIALLLSEAERAVEEGDRLIALATELKLATMDRIFTCGTPAREPAPSEIGAIPPGWTVHKLDSIATLKSGGTPSRTTKAYWLDGTIPWVKTGEVDNCTIIDTEEKITPEGLSNSSAKLFPAGTLLMAMYGQGVTRGKVAMLGIEAATNQACVALFPKEGAPSAKYLFYLFQHRYQDIRRLGHGANQKNLSADILRTYLVPAPSDSSEQREIVRTLEVIDEKLELETRRRAALQSLSRTLLDGLMSERIPATDLDWDHLRAIPAPEEEEGA